MDILKCKHRIDKKGNISMKVTVFVVLAMCATNLFAQQSGRDSFVQQQAYAAMQRLTGQIDVLQANVDDLSARLARLEGAKSSDEVVALRARIESLESTVAALRKELANQRGEIVKDLSSRLAKMPQQAPAAQQSKKEESAASGPYREYEVAAGDNLWLIAKAFNTTVQKIRSMNGLKSDSLKVGQKIKVPME